MKVEIWSDVMCPFCYIGKRKFEQALEKFEHKDDIEVEWKSFQLNPDLEDQPYKSIYEYLAESKGKSLEWSKQMHAQVVEMAKTVGLDYNFDIAKVANSFHAHRLLQLAKSKKKGSEMEERLFHAYFTEGAMISDPATLKKLALEVGLPEKRVDKIFSGMDYADQVYREIHEAQQLGATGVPFFVIDRRYGISGAQDSQLFLETLEKAYAERGK
ncbi:MAG: DsbA family oxidoreductase [Saprospiraceae bacterium]|nr:DsbA family oxidoreductase [Saprospiraceae bacterium]